MRDVGDKVPDKGDIVAEMWGDKVGHKLVPRFPELQVVIPSLASRD